MYVAWTVSIKVYPQCNRKLTEWPSHWHWTAVGPPVHRHPSTLPAAHPQALRHYTPLPPLCKTHLLNKPFSLPIHDCYFTKDFIHSHIIYNILKIFSHISKFIRNTEFRKCFSSSKKQRQPLVKTHQFSNIEILVQGILYLFITFHNIFQNIRSESTAWPKNNLRGLQLQGRQIWSFRDMGPLISIKLTHCSLGEPRLSITKVG